MKKTKESASFINIGSSSLLMIFIVLSLVTFAILSFTSAQSDYNLSKRLATRKAKYYEVTATTEAVVAQIDQILENQALLAGDNKHLYFDSIQDVLNSTQIDGIPLFCNTIENELALTFSVPIQNNQALRVILVLNDYTKSDTYYTIKSWQVISTDSWETDQSIQLLPMED